MFSPPIFFLHFESCLTRNGFCHLQAYNNFVEISLSPTKQTPTIIKREGKKKKKQHTRCLHYRKIATLAFDYRLVMTIYENSMTKLFTKQWGASLSAFYFVFTFLPPPMYLQIAKLWGHKYRVFTVQKTREIDIFVNLSR